MMATITTTPFEQLWEGLKLIMRHFEGEPTWPRTVSRKIGDEHPQTLVHNELDAMEYFKNGGDLLDYRINAYPDYTSSCIDKVAPTQLLIDLDLEDFENIEGALANTMSNIRKYFGPSVQPTILWTGNGYHIILTL